MTHLPNLNAAKAGSRRTADGASPPGRHLTGSALASPSSSSGGAAEAGSPPLGSVLSSGRAGHGE